MLYESVDSLPEEFYFVKPPQFKYGFQLPKDVDFTVYLGRHATAEDYDRADKLIVPGHTDLHLVEGPGNQWFDNYFDDVLTGDPIASSHLRMLIEAKCPEEFRGHQIAMVESLIQKRVTSRVLDATKDDPVLVKLRNAWDQTGLSHYDQINAIASSFARRDGYSLNNLKRIVDKAVPYIEGKRRQVVITRGGAHVHFLRALEYQTEYNPDKANGSAVISSIIDFCPIEEQEYEIIMDILKN